MSSGEIDFPLSSLSLSLKVKIPERCKATYRWSVKLLRVSSPLKLRKTSYIHRLEEEDDDVNGEAPWVLIEANEDMLVNLEPQQGSKN